MNGCKARYPIVGGFSTHALADLGEILGGDAELISIITHLAMLHIISMFKHLHEARDDVGVLKRDI